MTCAERKQVRRQGIQAVLKELTAEWRDRIGKQCPAEILWQNETTSQRLAWKQPLIRASGLAAAGSVRVTHPAILTDELRLAREIEVKDPASLDAMSGTKRKLERKRNIDQSFSRDM